MDARLLQNPTPFPISDSLFSVFVSPSQLLQSESKIASSVWAIVFPSQNVVFILQKIDPLDTYYHLDNILLLILKLFLGQWVVQTRSFRSFELMNRDAHHRSCFVPTDSNKIPNLLFPASLLLSRHHSLYLLDTASFCKTIDPRSANAGHTC